MDRAFALHEKLVARGQEQLTGSGDTSTLGPFVPDSSVQADIQHPAEILDLDRSQFELDFICAELLYMERSDGKTASA